MGLRDRFQRQRQAPAPPTRPEPSTRDGGWRSVRPPAGMIDRGGMGVSDGLKFRSGLASWQNPAFGSALGHSVSSTAPVGVMHIARRALHRPGGYSGGGPLPLVARRATTEDEPAVDPPVVPDTPAEVAEVAPVSRPVPLRPAGPSLTVARRVVARARPLPAVPGSARPARAQPSGTPSAQPKAAEAPTVMTPMLGADKPETTETTPHPVSGDVPVVQRRPGLTPPDMPVLQQKAASPDISSKPKRDVAQGKPAERPVSQRKPADKPFSPENSVSPVKPSVSPVLQRKPVVGSISPEKPRESPAAQGKLALPASPVPPEEPVRLETVALLGNTVQPENPVVQTKTAAQGKPEGSDSLVVQRKPVPRARGAGRARTGRKAWGAGKACAAPAVGAVRAAAGITAPAHARGAVVANAREHDPYKHDPYKHDHGGVHRIRYRAA